MPCVLTSRCLRVQCIWVGGTEHASLSVLDILHPGTCLAWLSGLLALLAAGPSSSLAVAALAHPQGRSRRA
eukprot:6920523-Prymnesium_polylepis.1